MAARRYSQPSDGSVFLGILGVLFIVALVIKYIWWFVGAAVLAGVVAAVVALVKEEQKRRELAEDEAAEREFDLQRSAERQQRWTVMGDKRAIYGEKGAAAMHALREDSEGKVAQDDSPVARLATTAAELDVLIQEKPQAWPHALFASILVQRTTPLLTRLRDSELGFTAPSSTVTLEPRQLAPMVVNLIDEMIATAHQVESFVMTPAFMGAFADVDDSGPDAEAIAHIAHRTADYLERLLDISERCRGLPVRSDHTDIVTDCARMLDDPIQSFREFIADYVDIVDALPRVLEHATGDVNMGSLGLFIKIDDKRHTRIIRRLDAITRA